jgi:hypothetical protein
MGCQYEGCQIKCPSFNYKGGPPKYCSKHKKEGMINVRRKKCQYKGCNTIPSFNYKEQSPNYCSKHKKEGMENVVSKKNVNMKDAINYQVLIIRDRDQTTVLNIKKKE